MLKNIFEQKDIKLEYFIEKHVISIKNAINLNQVSSEEKLKGKQKFTDNLGPDMQCEMHVFHRLKIDFISYGK